MDMGVSEVLIATAEYLRQCSSDENEDPLEVKPGLLTSLEKASSDAAAELSGEC